MSQTSKKGTKKGEEQEKLLTDISGKMTMFLTKTDELSTTMKDIVKAIEAQTTILQDIAQHMKNNTAKGTTNNEDTLPILREMNDIQILVQAQKQKDQMSEMWKRQLNERKKAFWRMYRNKKTAEIYKEWNNKEKPILPSQFLIKEVDGEVRTETELRANLALCKFNTEISLMETRQKRYEETFLSIDTAMLTEISEKHTGLLQEKIKTMWKEETTREEEISIKLWEKNKLFFEEYEKNYGDESIMKMKPRKKNNVPAPQENENNVRPQKGKQNGRNTSKNRNPQPTYAKVAAKPSTKRNDITQQDIQTQMVYNQGGQQGANTYTQTDSNYQNESEFITVQRRGRRGIRGGGQGRGARGSRGGVSPYRPRGRGIQPRGTVRGRRQHLRGRGQSIPRDFLGNGYHNLLPDPNKKL